MANDIITRRDALRHTAGRVAVAVGLNRSNSISLQLGRRWLIGLLKRYSRMEA
jgi:hypothetical protein